MVPFSDLGLMARFRESFPECTVVWCPREQAGQYFSKLVEDSSKGEGGRGLPGIAVWRVGAPVNMGEQTLPKATMGWRDAQTLPDRTFHFVQTVAVRCEYEITIWCVNQSELNAIERRLSFGWQYQPIRLRLTKPPKEPIEPTVHDPLLAGEQDKLDAYETALEAYELQLNLYNELQDFLCPWYQTDSVYSYTPDEKSGKVLWFGLNRQVTLDTHWIKTSIAPFIDEINIAYKEMTDGNPINDIDLGVQIIVNPERV